MIFSPHDLSVHIETVGRMHSEHAKEAVNAFRRWDGKTPYLVHPLWCMSAIACEQNLDNDLRIRGMLVLLYHDVLEDTDGVLPINLPEDVVLGIKQMTFECSAQEREVIWDKPAEIRLFKLYDKTSNMQDAYEKNREKIAANHNYIRLLIADVVKNYGNLNIITIAKALLAAAE